MTYPLVLEPRICLAAAVAKLGQGPLLRGPRHLTWYSCMVVTWKLLVASQPSGSFLCFLALRSTRPDQYPAVQERMQSRVGKRGQRKQEALSSRHVTEQLTRTRNVACCGHIHVCAFSWKTPKLIWPAPFGFHFSNDPLAFNHYLQLLGYSGVVIL